MCALYDDAYGATIAAAGITPAWAAATTKMAIIYTELKFNYPIVNCLDFFRILTIHWVIILNSLFVVAW